MVLCDIILVSGIACHHLNKTKTPFVSWKTGFTISSLDQLFAKYEKMVKNWPKQGHIAARIAFFR